MTPAPSLVGLFVAPLDRAGIEYMVTGGLAAVIHGHPRLTPDIDLVIRLAPHDARVFPTLWSPDARYCQPTDVIAEVRARDVHGTLNVGHNESAMRADVSPAGDDELNAWALQHRQLRQVEGQAVQVAPIESVNVGKLRYFRMGRSHEELE